MSNDLREEVLDSISVSSINVGDFIYTREEVFQAMDIHFEKRSMELLEWMRSNDVKFFLTPIKDDRNFFYKGEWITKEALFQNFL